MLAGERPTSCFPRRDAGVARRHASCDGRAGAADGAARRGRQGAGGRCHGAAGAVGGRWVASQVCDCALQAHRTLRYGMQR